MQNKKKTLLTGRVLSVFFLIVVIQLISCKKDQSPVPAEIQNGYSVTIHVSPVFGDEPLQLLTKKYVTAANDTITISQLEFYFSNIRLTKTDSTIVYPETYFLIDFSNPASASIKIDNLPKATYNKLSFLVGVDSIHNHSGAQTGALDPAYNMFWGWITGYIFYRINGFFGTSPNSFSLDLGGDANKMIYDLPTSVSLDANRTINLKMDIRELFQNPYSYDLKVDDKNIHNTTATGITKLVQNSKDMFTITSIQ